MNTEPSVLYIKDGTDTVRFWSISVEDWDIKIEFGQLGGSIQTKYEEVLEGKAGRTRKEQIMLQMASRISSKRDKGYSHKIEDASKKATNAMGLKKPMLAKKHQDVTIPLQYDIHVQYKYDGHRCLVTKQNGVVSAYSRNGKPINSIEHILRDIPIEEGETLDGELYCHGEPLQRISSWVRKPQENSMKLEYMIYDIMVDKPYAERALILDSRAFILPCRVVPNLPKSSYERELGLFSIAYNLKAAIDKGYEGLIIRWGNKGYNDGKRCKHLVKVKAWLDEEFLVTDIKSSKDGWAILVCETRGKIFSVSAPGTIADKQEVLENKTDYIGRKVKVEFANRTSDGVPFHPVAIMWRDKE